MSDNTSDVELCLEYLDKHVEDDDEIDIILYQEDDEGSIDSGNDNVDDNDGAQDDDDVEEFTNGNDIDNDGLEDGNIVMDVEAISTSKRPAEPRTDCKNLNTKKLNTKADKLTTDDAQIIATVVCQYSQTYKNTDLSDTDTCDYTITKAKINEKNPTNPVDLGSYQCMKCLYNTNTKYLLVRHLKKHINKTFKCSACGKDFKCKQNLKKHIKLHIDIKTFDCTNCGQTFTTPWKLMFHRKLVHSGKKPTQCTECGVSFFELHALKVHMRSHTNERPYRCSQCTHASYTASALKIHMRSHTNERLYKCYICHASYKKMTDLKLHMGRHQNNSLSSIDLINE